MKLRALTAQVLTLGLLHLALSSGAPKLSGAPHTDVKQRIENFGVGADLKLKLEDGKKVRGVVESIGDSSFVVVSEKSGRQEIAFNDLKNLSYPKRGYKAEGAPDPVLAKRMVVQLGVGEHIMVKVLDQKVRGHIREIHADHFVVQPDGQAATLQVPYENISKVNKNLSFGATLAIVIGIAAAVVLILVLSGEDEIDVLPN
jgi:ribosome maturation factor RimP